MKNQVNSPELIAELEAIKQENAALKASFENVLSEKQKIEFNLGERMKELRCHNQISEILNENDLTINEVIEKIVQVLPAAMQFPEKATARISVYDFVFISPYFIATKNSIAREIVLSGEVVGQIEVCYPEVQLLPTEQIFLPEESDLLFSIAGRIGHFIERFQKDEALRQSETTYRKLVETINDVIYKIAADGTILYVSPAIERMLGYKPDELIGKSFLNFVYEPDRSLVSDKFSNLQKRDYDYLEYRLVTKSAAFCWVRSSTTPIYENGKFTGGTGTLTNITDQKIVEHQLQNSESLYRSILAASPDAITITDLEGKILFESPRAVEMFGYENAEELLGHPMLEYIDPAYHQKAINGITCMFQGTLLGAEEYKGFRKDGSTFDIEVNGEFIRDKAGQPQKMIFVTRDITHRKQIESALKDSEEKLRNLVNSQTNYVLRTDLEGRHTYWNRKFEEDFGWIYIEKGLDKSDSLLSICDYHHQRALDTVIKCLEEPGKIIKIELDKPVLHGEIRTTLWEFVCLTDSDNFPTEIQCMGIDISDRKQAEQQLLQSEHKYKTLFEDSPIGYLIFCDGHFIECNKAAEKLVGADRNYLLGASPEQLSPEYQPNGRKSDEYAADLFQQALDKGNISFEWVHKKADGTEFLVLINIAHIRFQGKVALFNTWQDITNKRKAEDDLRKLSRAVEQSPISIVITNLDGNIEYVNPKACETTGYNAQELIGKNPRVLKSGATQKTEYDVLWGNISTGKEWHGIFHNKRKNGELYWESSTISPIFDAEGKITNYLAIKEDITERRNIQMALQKSQERLTQIAEISQTMVWEINAEGLYTYVSPVAAQILGLNPEQVIDKLNIIEPVREDFKELARNYFQKRENVIQFVCPIFKADMQMAWVEVNGAPIFDSENNFLGYRGGINDITQRKLAEEELLKFRTISDQSNNGNAIADLNGNLIYVNEAWAEMHGYEIDEMIGKHLSMLHTGQQMIRVNEALELLKTQGGFSAEEVWRTKKDGTAFPSLMNAKIIFDSKNQPLFLSASAIDITQIKESEEIIRNSEDRLNNAQELANMGSWEFNVKTGKVNWSKNYYKLVGIDPSERPLSLEEIRKMVHPDDRENFESKMKEMMVSLSMETIYFRMEDRKGNNKWIQANMVPKFENDQLVAINGVSIDITDKKEAEEKIRQQNNRLNAIISAMPDLIFISDSEGNYLEYFSNRSSDLLIPKEKLIGANLRDAFDAPVAELQLKKIKECLSEKKLVSFEYYGFQDGRQKFYEARLAFLEDNKVLRFVRDITERKLWEKEIRRLNLAIEQSPVSIVITDLDANIEYVNPAFIKASGYSEEELLGQSTRIIQSGKTKIATYKVMWETITAGKIWQGEWMNKRKNGELYWESVSITPIFDNENTITNYLAIKQDITAKKEAENEIRDLNANLEVKIVQRTNQLSEMNENLLKEIEVRKQVEEELIKAKIEADQANLAKSEFLSRMSHELRTPMNSILGFGQLLQMGELNTSQKKGVDHIIKSGKHLLDLINEVLDISRIESGRLSLSIEPVQLIGIIMEMIDTVNPLAKQRNINIQLVNSPDNYLFVKSDRQRLKQVLLNLISNAIKYNKEGGSITIRTMQMPMTGDGRVPVQISITDTGIGISPENIKKLFRPFERIGAERTSIEGSGLGLAVVKKLMDAMDGEIGVDSKIEEGSNFWFKLPSTKSQFETAGNLDIETETGSDLMKKTGTILYVEDNVSNIELVTQTLASQRPEVKLFSISEGKQTLPQALEIAPDLILLDLNLPDIHGSEVLDQLLADEKTKLIPVIIISADAMPQQLTKLIKAGAKKYLTKPLDLMEFLKVIDEYIH